MASSVGDCLRRPPNAPPLRTNNASQSLVQSREWVGDRQGDLVCCSPWAYKGSDTTEWLNWTDLNWPSSLSSDLPEAVWTLAQPQEILACLSLMPLEILALWKTGKERVAVGFCEDSLPSFPMNPHCLVFSALFSTCWSPIILNEACLVDYLSCFFLTAVFELCL